MYNDNDLEGAAADGVFTPQAVAAFRERIAEHRHFPRIDEEHYRIFDGSNDAFVAIGSLLALAGLANLAYLIAPVLGGMAVMLGAWALSEYFIRERRLTLTGILLSLAFVLGIVATFALGIFAMHPSWGPKVFAGVATFLFLICAVASRTYWDRFRVPYAMSFVPFFAAMVVLSISVLVLVDERTLNPFNVLAPVALLCGIGMFAYAMTWDMSDRERVTDRHEIALWLHGAAAGMIVQPLFYLVGVTGTMFYFVTFGQLLVVLLSYALFVFVGLAIDRRALPFAGLLALLYAVGGSFYQLGAFQSAFGLTGILVGGGILLLSVFWHQARAVVVPMLGTLGDRLPPVVEKDRY